MAKRKTPRLPMLRIKPGDRLKAIYAKARRALTAADVQKYTERGEVVPARDILADLEALDRQEAAALKKRRKRGRPR